MYGDVRDANEILMTLTRIALENYNNYTPIIVLEIIEKKIPKMYML